MRVFTGEMTARLTSTLALAALAVGCGPPGEAKEPREESFEFLAPPDVSFNEELDIQLKVPDDPGELPMAERLWKIPGGTVLGQAGHLVMVVDEREGRVRAVDVRDGGELWSSGIPECPLCSLRLTPVFDGQRVLVSSGNVLVAMDAADGSELWRRELDGLPDGEAVVMAPGVVALRTMERRPGPPCGSVTTRVLFLGLEDGAVLWRMEFVGLFAWFAIAGQYLHVVVSDGCAAGGQGPTPGYTMRVYDILSHEETAREAVPEPWAPLLVAGGYVVIQGSGSLAAYAPGRVQPTWTRQLDPATQTAVTTATTLVLVRTDGVEALEPASGKTIWERDLGDTSFRQGLNVLPTIGAGDDLILVPTAPDPMRGYLVVLDPQTGQVRRFFLGYGPIYQTLVWGKVGVLLDGEAVLGVDLVQEGTPERDLVPVGAAVTLLVNELEDEVPFVPWEAASLEVERLGDQALAKLAELAGEGSLVAGLLVARVLKASPDEQYVSLLTELIQMPPPGTDESLLPVHSRMVWECIRALGGLASPDAVEALARVMRDDDLEPALRSAAYTSLGGLAVKGIQAASDEVTGYRHERAQATASGWKPCPVPVQRLEFHGPFRVPLGSCKVSLDTPFSVSGSVMSPDGEWLAYVSPTLGGRNDVWLAHTDQGKLDGPWFTGWTVPGRIELQYLEPGEDSTLILENVERECAGCYWSADDVPTSGKPAETILDPQHVARDSDKDGYTDLLETRLGTDPKKKDTDGDGLKDREDPAPLSGAGASDVRAEVLVEAFMALLGFGESSEPLYVVGTDELNLTWEGYPAVVLHMSRASSEQMHSELGLPGPAMLTFGCALDESGSSLQGCQEPGSSPDVEDALGFVLVDENGTRARFSATMYRSGADAALYHVELQKLDGRWFVTTLDLAILG